MFQKHVNLVMPFVAILHKPIPGVWHPEFMQVLSDIIYAGLECLPWFSDSLIINEQRAKQQLFGQSAIIHFAEPTCLLTYATVRSTSNCHHVHHLCLLACI